MVKTVYIQSEDRPRPIELDPIKELGPYKEGNTGLLVYKIDGLSPGDIDVNTSERPYDGDYFVSTRKAKRVISLYIKPLWIPTKTIEQLRTDVYKYFPYKKRIDLTFITETRTGMISGYVSNISADIFSAAEVFQIDITCPDPYFSKSPTSTVDFFTYEALSHFKMISPKTVKFTGDGVTKSFGIPEAAYVGNEGNYDSYQKIFTPEDILAVRVNGATLVKDEDYVYVKDIRHVMFTVPPADESKIEIDIYQPGNPVSARNYSLQRNINYSGEVDTGVLIRVIFFRTYKKSFWVGKSDDNQWINVDVSDDRLEALLRQVLPHDFPSLVTVFTDEDYHLKPRDMILIDTNPGKKGIYLVRKILGKDYYLSLANCVFDSSDRPFVWWSIGLGDNDVTIGSNDSDILEHANFAIDYADKYAGL